MRGATCERVAALPVFQLARGSVNRCDLNFACGGGFLWGELASFGERVSLNSLLIARNLLLFLFNNAVGINFEVVKLVPLSSRAVKLNNILVSEQGFYRHVNKVKAVERG